MCTKFESYNENALTEVKCISFVHQLRFEMSYNIVFLILTSYAYESVSAFDCHYVNATGYKIPLMCSMNQYCCLCGRKNVCSLEPCSSGMDFPGISKISWITIAMCGAFFVFGLMFFIMAARKLKASNSKALLTGSSLPYRT
ncbi:hypothetical protein HDE_07794 [Halotydeus destructor]|nr:hypothetical protein HDE_07794 [Halotydeus destructor]